MIAGPIVEAAPAAVTAVAMSMPRLFVFMAVVPLFHNAVFPRLVRIAIAVGLGAPVALGVYHQLGPQPVPLEAAALVLKECVLGLLLGLPVACPFWAISSVGSLTDNQRGANAAQMVTPFAQADSSVLGSSLSQALVVTLCASGAFGFIYQLLLESFEVWPVLQLVPDAAQFGWELSFGRFDEFVARALLYAAPVIAIILLVDFAFALMSVFAPQLQTYFAAMPIKSLVAIGMLALYLFVLIAHGEDYFREMIRIESTLLDGRSR